MREETLRFNRAVLRMARKGKRLKAIAFELGETYHRVQRAFWRLSHKGKIQTKHDFGSDENV